MLDPLSAAAAFEMQHAHPHHNSLMLGWNRATVCRLQEIVLLLTTRDQTYGTAQKSLLGRLHPHVRKHSSSCLDSRSDCQLFNFSVL